MLKVTNLRKTYKDVIAVDNLNLEVQSGEIYGFIGPNGAGKTTTIKSICGMVKPDKGTISINGYDLHKQAIKAKESFYYVPDKPILFPKLKAGEYLDYIAIFYNLDKRKAKESIEKYTKLFGIENELGNFIESFSHGMTQKLTLVCAFMVNPKLLILDEPIVGLDPRSSQKLRDLLVEHANNGNAVIFSTHVLEIAEKVCSKYTLINKGKVVKQGDMSDVRESDDSLNDIFMELTDD